MRRVEALLSLPSVGGWHQRRGTREGRGRAHGGGCGGSGGPLPRPETHYGVTEPHGAMLRRGLHKGIQNSASGPSAVLIELVMLSFCDPLRKLPRLPPGPQFKGPNGRGTF